MESWLFSRHEYGSAGPLAAVATARGEVIDASTAVADGPGSRQTLQTLLSGRGLLLTLSHNGEWQLAEHLVTFPCVCLQKHKHHGKIMFCFGA